MVLPLLAEGIRQPREAANAHANAQVAALHDRRANAFRIGLAHDWDHLHGRYFGGAVALLLVLRGAIDLDELREVAAVVQRVRDRRAVRREAVSCDLEVARASRGGRLR